jgi:monovalent cation/hydrogen antiporter
MALFEIAITLLLAGALLSAVARRFKVPYPALLALAGLALGLLPDLPTVTLDPQVALTLFVAPVLLDAAFDSSPRDLKENWRAVAGLALGAVVVTVIAVAVVARWMMPALSWPVAIALGALVAPPDAAAATAVLKQLRPPHRVLVILEGESLFNDASALLIYRMAVAATAAAGFSGWTVAPRLLAVAAGSVVAGAVLARLSIVANDRIRDVATAVIVQFLSTFLVWILAEWLQLSGIITVVVFAILVARVVPVRTPARLRIPSYAVWEVAVFVLNVLAFLLVGLQVKPIIENLSRAQLLSYAATAAAVCAAVILVRIAWVMGYACLAQLVRRRLSRPRARPPTYPSLRAAAAIAWCGMRGIVTLAAALALPAGFPHRDLVLFSAFAVVLVTLVVQGMTLSPLLRLLRLEEDSLVDREVALARAETARAGLSSLEGTGSEMLTLLRRKYEARLQRAERTRAGGEDAPGGAPDEATGYLQAIQRAQTAERQHLFDLRTRGVIGDDAFHKVEEELDWAELNTEAMART